MKINWTGFSKKTPAERLQMLKEKELLQDEHWQLLNSQQTLPLETANQMSENVLATLAQPYPTLWCQTFWWMVRPIKFHL